MRKRLSETATVPALSFLGGGDARNPRIMLAWDASLAWTALLLLALAMLMWDVGALGRRLVRDADRPTRIVP